jgi:hypothetical protein
MAWAKTRQRRWKTMIVQKDKDLPNEGREGSSFIWAIRTLRPVLRPDDQVAFVQGNPLEHTPDLWDLLQSDYREFSWLGNAALTSLCDGHPHHPDIPVQASHRMFCVGEWPGEIRFAAGGQFVATGRELKGRSAAEWKCMYEWSMREENAPWILERLWGEIFCPSRPRSTMSG